MRFVGLLAACAVGAALCGGAVAPTGLYAQATATGTILGQVTDPSGAAVPGTVISLTDPSTGITRTTRTNRAGRYLFLAVKLGTYDLSAARDGFRTAQIRHQAMRVGVSLTENFRLELGAASQVVDVAPTAVAELQTLDASQGTSIDGATALALPNLGRDASSLLLYQADTSPGCACGFLAPLFGGEIGGSTRDQNTYLLDGGINTSDTDGDGSEYTSSFSANNSGSGILPTPVESIAEIRVTTNNPGADYTHAGGGEIMMVTKRGTSRWHGSLYDYFQGDWLDANTWDNNRLGLPRQKNHQNRFGGAIGGTLLPHWLGGKTYFYANYEGWQFPQAETLTTTVPSALMRQGILQVPDGTGAIEQYNLATSTACGPSGGLACDPRHIGISPVVAQLWNKYLPQGNDTSTVNGTTDGLNTIADNQQVQFPQSSNFLVTRIDHDFGPRWQWMASYRYFRQEAPYAGSYDQVDWGGILPGDTLGQPAITSRHPVQPRYFVTSLTGEISPNLTNQFHFNYVRNWWAWTTAGVPQLEGIPAGVDINGLDGINIDWPSARQRNWNGHDWNYMDDVSWIHGNHIVHFGASLYHTWVNFSRDDGSGALTTPEYELGDAGIQTSDLYRPPSCSATLTTGCIAISPAQWDSLYYETLGVLSSASQLLTRSGADLSLQPPGSLLRATSAIDTYSLYASDSWQLTPRLTLTYGLNWGVEMPPFEQDGHQVVLVTANGTPVSAASYLATKETQALAGENYNPALGYEPVSAMNGGEKYPYRPYYGGLGPRLALAWNPHFDGGWLQDLFGHDATVLRGGWSRIFDRANGSNLVIVPLQGVGFGQGVTCVGANSASVTGEPATCQGVDTQTAATAFRLGPDGLTAPLPSAASNLATPIIPGVNSAAVGTGDTIDPDFRPASVDQYTVSLQRQLPGHAILELSWLGEWVHHAYRTIDLNNVPYMMTLGGQSFAQAYAGLAGQLSAHPGMNPNAVTPQPFFEAALAKGPGNYCANYASCTAAVAAGEGTNIGQQNVMQMWSDLEGNWVFGPALIQSQGLGGAELMTSDGYSTYNAGSIRITQRASRGLTLDGNFTWSHSLDDGAYVQASSGSQTVNPYDSRYDYGDSMFDLRYVMNILAVYQLPYRGTASGSGRGWARQAFGGWSIAPVLTYHSGDPLFAGDTSFSEFGQPPGNSVNDVSAIPTGPIPSPGVLRGVQTQGPVGSANNVSSGNPNGTQLNAFADPAAVLASFRAPILGQDTSRTTVFGFGPSAWNLDLNLRKDFAITEGVGATLNLEMMNAFNHINWQDPVLYTQEPTLFGTIPGPANNPRTMEIGLRLHW